MKWFIMVTQAGHTTSSDYSFWATRNGITGAWDEKDASGICNAFRYVFDVPSGDFRMPLVSIAIKDGKVAIKTPPVVNESGFSLSIVESSDVKGNNVTAVEPVTSTRNVIEFNKTGGSRFYRLKLGKTRLH